MRPSIQRTGPFHLDGLDARLPRPMAAMVRTPLESLLCFPRLNAVYDAVMADGRPNDFCQAVLDTLDITVNIARRELDRVPRTGPVVVVANHPFGGIEGLIMAAALLRVRPDTRVMANRLLGMIPEMRPVCIFVDVLGRDAAQKNIRGLKECIAHLRGGGALGVFPAGTVSHLHFKQRRIADPAWSGHVAALVRRTGASVVPMFFDGTNSKTFHLAGLINARLRTVLLPRELLNKQHATVTVRVGSVIPGARIAGFADDASAIGYLRQRTEALGAHRHGGEEEPPRRLPRLPMLPLPRRREAPPAVAPAGDAGAIARELAALPADTVVAESGDLRVFHVPAAGLRAVMAEVGRLREVTFRAVGEGSGRPRDLDAFDDHYTHLLLWNHRRQEIVGGYRLGASDVILPRFGRRGMYLSTLWEMSKDFWRELGPTIELGRSFIRPEYQKSFSPLMLLWKGIASVLSRQPRYRRLIGPVSISGAYTPTSRALIVAFLQQPAYSHPLTGRVTPRVPPSLRRAAPVGLLEMIPHLRDLDELDAVIADIEPDGKGVPVLLRQYLRLGARVLSFNVDPDFGYCIDALCVFDAADAGARPFRRYMGTAAASAYLAYADADEPVPQPQSPVILHADPWGSPDGPRVSAGL